MSSSSNRLQSSERSNSMARESFKCTAPCLYLPVFSKRKSMAHLTSEKRGTEEIPEELNKEPQPDNITECATNEVLRASSFDRFARSSCNSGTQSFIKTRQRICLLELSLFLR